MKTTILIVVAFLALCFVPVTQAQVTQSAQIAVNALNTTANIVTLDTAATALQETVTTPGPGALVCSTYPVVTFIVTRNAVNSTLAVVTMASGVYWQAFPLFTPLLPGDLIFAKLTTAGIGCTNELPLTVSTIYSPQAGLCDSNPSACVNLTGTIAATNGLTAKNLTLTFRPSQAAFLGGVPPNNPSSGGGSSAGICELLGVNPGDICYFSGSAWGILTGNNTGTKNLTENASGVPAWGVDPANYQHNDTSVAAQPALDFEDGGGVTFSLTNDSANNRAKVSAAVVSGGSVNYENLIPLWLSNCPLPGASCSDLISTQIPWFQSTFYRGPLAPTQPNSAWVQDKIGLVESVGDVAVTFDNPIIPGDSVYAVGFISCGLGCNGQNFTIADSIAGGGSNIYTDIHHDDGGGNAKPMLASYSSAVKGGITTVTFHPLSPGASYETVFHIFELRGGITPDVYVYDSPVSFPPITFLPLTTTTSPDVIIATAFANTTANAFTAGTGYKMLSQDFGTYSSLGSEITNESSTGTYTPTMTNSGSGSSFSGVFDVAFHITLPTSTADPVPGFIYYNDLVQGGDFPVLSGEAGKPLVANAAETGLEFGSFPASGVTSIQPQNNGTPYGSAQTGAITMNFANCTVSATFTITCPSGTGTVNSGTATHLGYYAGTGTAISDMGADFTFNTHTLAMGASGILDLHSGATSGFLLSGSFSTGFLTVTTSTGAVGSVATSGIKCYPYGGSGGTGCDTPSGSGLSNVVMPADKFGSSITGSVETVTTANQVAGYLMAAPPPGTTLSPYGAQPTVACTAVNSLNTYSCVVPAAIAAGDSLYMTWASKENNGSGIVTVVTDNHLETFSNLHADTYSQYGDAYFDNTVGGATTITLTVSGTLASRRVVMQIWDITQTAGFDTNAAPIGYCGTGYWNSVTPTVSSDLIIGSCVSGGDEGAETLTVGSGWLLGGPPFIQTSPYNIYAMSIYAIGGLAGVAVTPNMSVSYGLAEFQSFVVAFKPSTSGSSTGPWGARPLDFRYLWNTFPALHNYLPPLTSLYSGDTGIGLHQGAPINAEAVTSAYTGTVLFAVSAGNDLALDVDISVDCHTATGTLIPSFTYTTAGSDTITITGSTTICGTAPTSIRQSIRAKSGTNVTFTTTSLTNSPSYNVSARVTLQGTQ